MKKVLLVFFVIVLFVCGVGFVRAQEKSFPIDNNLLATLISTVQQIIEKIDVIGNKIDTVSQSISPFPATKPSQNITPISPMSDSESELLPIKLISPQIFYPQGGENLYLNEELTIRWTAPLTEKYVTFSLVSPSAQSLSKTSFIRQAENDGDFRIKLVGIVPGANYKLQMYSYETKKLLAQSNPFSILEKNKSVVINPSPISSSTISKILSPQMGERWILGNEYTIRWSVPADEQYVKLSIISSSSSDSFQQQPYLFDRVLNNGVYAFRLQNILQGNDYKIKMYSQKSGKLLAESDSFSIGGSMNPLSFLNIGNTKQFFFDDYIIDNMVPNKISYMKRDLKTFVRSSLNPVIKPQQLWEGKYILPSFSSIKKNSDGSLTMWYLGSAGTLIANSVNGGLTWTRPNLGLVSYNASTNNNIVKINPQILINSNNSTSSVRMPESIYYDTHTTDPNRRYMATTHHWTYGPIKGSNYDVRFSADGIIWNGSSANPIIRSVPGTYSVGEDAFLFGWDSNINKYVGYFRPNYPEPSMSGGCSISQYKKRSIGRSTSIDGLTWSPIQTVLRAPSEGKPLQYYLMTVYKTDGIYLGFVAELQTDYNCYDVYQLGATGRDNTTSIKLFFSRDGEAWQDFGPSVDNTILPISSEGSWDSKENWPTVPLEVGNEMLFFYGGSNVHHTNEWYSRLGTTYNGQLRQGAIGLAKIKKDRWMSIKSGPGLNYLLTKPFTFTGNNLVINYQSANVASKIKVEVQNIDGTPIPGFLFSQSIPMNGDEMNRIVRWNGNANIGTLVGTPIRLKFELYGSDLYSFQFTQ